MRDRPMGDSWAPYVPDDRSPWNLRRVVHLHRRAGFAATWSEVRRDLKDGPQASIDRLLAGKAATQGVPPDFAATADLLGEAAASSGDPARLKAWWVYRMLYGPDPLSERLALVWHDHFATSNLKVDNLHAMHRQNELFRKLGRAPFGELLNAVVRDPAMLAWLDAPANRKGHPNENLGRRANYASALVDGVRVGRPGPMDVLALAGSYGEKDIAAFATRLLLGTEPAPAWRARLASAADPKVTNEAEAARRTVALLLAMPEAQVA